MKQDVQSDWFRLGLLLETRLTTVLKTPGERFRWLVSLLIETPYELGAENPFGTDCSGLVCWALMRMGFNLRMNAAGLYDRVFVDEYQGYDRGVPQAAFFLTSREKVIHVAPFVGEGICANAGSEQVEFRRYVGLCLWFRHNREARAERRNMNAKEAEELSRTGQHAWGIDPTEHLLRG